MLSKHTKIYKYFCFALLFFEFSCSSSRNLPPTQAKSLNELIETSTVFSKNFTGFALYDPAKEQYLFEKNTAKYFTPASNTKIFTLYTALKILGDRLPLFHYIEKEDSLVFWGAANPIFLHPAFQEEEGFNFLQNTNKNLFFTDYNFEDTRYGAGWSWDDYRYYFQVEKSSLPVYGNVIRFQRDSNEIGLQIYPPFFAKRTQYNPTFYEERPYITRKEFSNTLEHNQLALQGPSVEKEIPFHYSPKLLLNLLKDTLQKTIQFIHLPKIDSSQIQTFSISNPDTLYRRLMQESDNFIAEQLLLMCSDQLFGIQKMELIIDYAKKNLFSAAEDELVWRDGSGLSRYNLFTPRTVIYVLDLLYKEFPEARLFDLFPKGGTSGTIKDWYQSLGTNLFAKTGTMSNRHCLSGYLKTKTNKTLIFSFMHMNYITNSDPLKPEMEKVLHWIAENY